MHGLDHTCIFYFDVYICLWSITDTFVICQNPVGFLNSLSFGHCLSEVFQSVPVCEFHTFVPILMTLITLLCFLGKFSFGLISGLNDGRNLTSTDFHEFCMYLKMITYISRL